MLFIVAVFFAVLVIAPTGARAFSWMRGILVFVPLIGFASSAQADEATDIKVRQLAAAGVYVSLCPMIEFGDGLVTLIESAGLTQKDISPGGRYREIMNRHAATLKASTEMAGTDPCERGLQLYGPKGFAFRNLVKPKGP